MAKLTKTAVVVDIMTKNKALPMAEVCALIERDLPCKAGYGKVWYRWAVKEGAAPGALEASPRAPKAKVAGKAAKAPKAVKPKVEAKSVDEVAEIKAKNLATLKAVSARTKKVRDYGDRVAKEENDGVSDFDPALAREEIDAILRDERLLDVCPKFIREDA